DLDVPVCTEHDVPEVEGHAHQGILAALLARAGPRSTPAALGSEEGLEDVAEASEPAEVTGSAVPAAHVVATARVVVAENVVSVRDELELLRRLLARVHIRVQLTRQLSVRLLDLVRRRVARHPENLIVVRHNHLPAC